MYMLDLPIRPRRLRQSESVRKLVSETTLTKDDLVYPIFVHDGQDTKISIDSLPGQYRYSLDGLLKQCELVIKSGVRAIALFPGIEDRKKTKDAKEALNENGLIPTALKKIKTQFPDLLLVTDIALDPFSADGHDGIVKNGRVLNDESVEILSNMALLHAESGADIVAPSDMMDGRVGVIRKELEKHGFLDTIILSYAIKYASTLYGPFRDALNSAPKKGDKKTYQMDFSNRNEALKEALLDINEGADMLMVKPASWYLDIIRDLHNSVNIPIAGYHVSGEYAMLKFAAEKNIIDFKLGLREVLTAIKRSGASLIFTYGALEF